jgi:hypothetical protein
MFYGLSQKGEGRTKKDFLIKNKTESEIRKIIIGFLKENEFKIEKVNENKYIGKMGSTWKKKLMCFEIAILKTDDTLKVHGEFYIPQLPPVYELDLNPHSKFGEYSRKPAFELMNKFIQTVQD